MRVRRMRHESAAFSCRPASVTGTKEAVARLESSSPESQTTSRSFETGKTKDAHGP